MLENIALRKTDIEQQFELNKAWLSAQYLALGAAHDVLQALDKDPTDLRFLEYLRFALKNEAIARQALEEQLKAVAEHITRREKDEDTRRKKWNGIDRRAR